MASRQLPIDSPIDLGNKKVIAFLGAYGALGPDFREAVRANEQYREIQNHRAQVRLLTANRVDVIVVDLFLVERYLDYLEGERELVPRVVFHDIFPESRLKFVCRSKELMDDYRSGVEDLRRSGELDAIWARYQVPESKVEGE